MNKYLEKIASKPARLVLRNKTTGETYDFTRPYERVEKHTRYAEIGGEIAGSLGGGYMSRVLKKKGITPAIATATVGGLLGKHVSGKVARHISGKRELARLGIVPDKVLE